MGEETKNFGKLDKLEEFARTVDSAIYESACFAIQKRLPAKQLPDQNPPGATRSSNKSDTQKWVFPFDILLLGGDDLVMVTPASSAMDVALTIAKRFNELTIGWGREGNGYRLSVGVILPPLNIPSGCSTNLQKRL